MYLNILSLQEAKKSISFYRQLDVKSKEVEAEIAKIRLQMDPRLEILLEADDGKYLLPQTNPKNS